MRNPDLRSVDRTLKISCRLPFFSNASISSAGGVGKAVDLVEHVLGSDMSDTLHIPLVRTSEDILASASY